MEKFALAEAERLWCRQLVLEHQDICDRYRLILRTPVFTINNGKSRAAFWDSVTGTMSFSSHLILQNSWDVTINVLKHEMAHQICSDIYLSSDSPHGTLFQEACETLGVPEVYRRSAGELPVDLSSIAQGGELSTEGRRCLRRVHKLLALGKSANEHEAALAMEKANELMRRHNIRSLAQGEEADYTYVIINRKRKIVPTYQKSICAILRDFFRVYVVLDSLYDPHHDCSYKVVELMGTKENVKVAEYCHDFLENQLQALWNEQRRSYRGSLRGKKNGFYLGVLHGFREKMRQGEERARDNALDEKNEMSPVVVEGLLAAEKERLAAFVSSRFPRLVSRRSSGPMINKESYEQGVEKGRKLNLHRGVSQKKDGLSGLLR